MNESIMTADRLEPGRVGRIIELRDCGALTRRLMELGLIPGAVLLRRHTAPGGSPIAYEAGGTLLALRAKDAAQLLVREEDLPWTP